MFVCCFARKFKKKKEERERRGGIRSGLPLQSKNNLGKKKNPKNPKPTQRSKAPDPPPLPSARVSSRLLFSEIPLFPRVPLHPLPPPLFSLSPPPLPLLPCPRRSQKPLYAQLPAAGAELRGAARRGAERHGGGIPPGREMFGRSLPGTAPPLVNTGPGWDAEALCYLLVPKLDKRWGVFVRVCEKNHATHPH